MAHQFITPELAAVLATVSGSRPPADPLPPHPRLLIEGPQGRRELTVDCEKRLVGVRTY